MEKYLSIVNIRTFVALGITLVSVLSTIYFDFEYNFDLTMFSIAIIFPLVFTIRSAFKRREKALEYLSRFRSGLITADSSIQANKRLTVEEKEEARGFVLKASELLVTYLGPESISFALVRDEVRKISEFIDTHNPSFKMGPALKIHGFMRDVYMGIENTSAIKEHRTPTSIRAYCLIFIYLYPVIYTPSLYYRMGAGLSGWDLWVLYFLALFSSFILISLFNVQEQLENPYDQQGLDDIKLDEFKVSRKDLVNFE